MLASKLLANEAERLKALYDLQILDTPREERFDRLVRIAQRLFNVPIVLVGLIDENRQWYKSCIGLPNCEVERNSSFCTHTILSPDILYISDTYLDERFANHPAVINEPHVRFYAGAPLIINERYGVGTLCLMDTQVRQLSDDDLKALRDLADMVQQQLEKQLRDDLGKMLSEEKARHQLLFETMLDGMVVIDQFGVIENSNKALQTLLGQTEQQLQQHLLAEFIKPSSQQQYWDYLNSCIQHYHQGLQNQRCESIVCHQDGHLIEIELLFSPMSFYERLLFTVIVRDITERKAIEKIKNEFVSTISHELRTPLTSIKGALSLVLSKASDELSPKAKMLLTTASRNSERLSLLINDILDLEKIDSGKLSFNFKMIDLAVLLEQALLANEGYATHNHVNLRISHNVASGIIYADDNRLLQVFANLISNAIKYSLPQGTVELSLQEQAGNWRIGIRDYGRGIPEEFKVRIFQRFAQADSSDTREKNGTGLGLTISKAIIEHLGGTIGYQSELEQGAEFFFSLPKLTTIYPPQNAKANILICEDNNDVALILAELLAQETISSDIAYNAQQAKTKLAQKDYQAMLLDLNLPDQDGIALLADIRQNAHYAHLPVIIVSGRAQDKQLINERLSVIDWLQKPIDRQQLHQALHRCLTKKTHRAKILHIEDEADVIQVTQMLIEGIADYYFATSLAQARHLLQQYSFDVVLLDLKMPDGSGLELLSEINANSQVLVFTGAEINHVLSKKITMALTKANTTNQQLLNTIKKLIAKSENKHD